jgi:hypothetical protein
MEKEILHELRELKNIISQVIGSSDLPKQERFSKDAIAKAAKEFQKMAIERGEWVKEDDIAKYIKNAGWRSGAFIREHFSFSNHFKRGREYFYNKKDLTELGKKLKERNVNLRRYIEYIEDREKFKKAVQSGEENKKAKKKSYIIPEEAKDIETSDVPKPPADVIKEHLRILKEDFFKNDLSEYVDIYNGTHAMMKHMYYFDRYIPSEKKKKCRKWCEDFNYANDALERVTRKKEEFIPVKDDDMIEL